MKVKSIRKRIKIKDIQLCYIVRPKDQISYAWWEKKNTGKDLVHHLISKVFESSLGILETIFSFSIPKKKKKSLDILEVSVHPCFNVASHLICLGPLMRRKLNSICHKTLTATSLAPMHNLTHHHMWENRK